MRKIFLDTSYLQALADSRDNLHELATVMTARLGKAIPHVFFRFNQILKMFS
jgi:predicted nucleic acid-binding protein